MQGYRDDAYHETILTNINQMYSSARMYSSGVVGGLKVGQFS